MSKTIANVPKELKFRLQLYEIYTTEAPLNVLSEFIENNDMDVVRRVFASGIPGPRTGTYLDEKATEDLLRDVRYNYALGLVYGEARLHVDQGKALEEALRLAGEAMTNEAYFLIRGQTFALYNFNGN